MMKLAIAATAMGVLLFGGAVAGQPSRRQQGQRRPEGCRFDANVGRPPASNAAQIRLCHYDHIHVFRKR
ncbi:hypothetical protein [Allorhizocola rhizosphaerae]|uniref:hypothetical protein n=1 Tax=Allorhizocola rhizosphaerae TaxID=1872709 RepID=UPI000E3B6F37|nr:hypothetical protein [Allorhizocola rhizosphaerae]